jgi:hypothetical protein
MSAVVAAVVRDALGAIPGVTSRIGSGANLRCYAGYRPATQLPAIVLTYGEDRDVSPSHQRTDRVRRLDVTIDCIGATLSASRLLAEAVRVGLHGAAGTGRESTQVFEIRVISCSTEFDIGAEGTEPETHITTVRAECTYRSPAVSPITITDPGGPV